MADLANSSGDNRSLPVPVARSGGGVPPFERLREIAAQPAIARSLPLIMLIGLLGVAAMAWSMLSQPAQRPLFTGLSDSDKAAVAQALESAGVKYALDRDTGAITVSDANFYQAKMLLAQAGLPKSAPDGDAMISALPMGASRAVEGERLRGAREMDLARTIEAIDAVETARVHLAVEPPSVFLRDETKAAASVMLRLHAGRALSDSQVQAIVNLVASSVPGLAPDGVSVVDQTGRLLSASGNDAAGQATNQQVQIQQKIEARYIEALNKLLVPIVGAGNFTAEVHTDLDFAQVQSTRESFPKDTQVVREEQGAWENDAATNAGAAGGIPGTLSNQAPPAAQVAAAPGGAVTPTVPGAVNGAAGAVAGKTSENYNRSYQLDREISVTKAPVGTVRRLSVAVAIKEGAKKLKPIELAQLDALVKGAVGFDQARGDVVALSARKFAEVEEAPPAPWYEASWLATVLRNFGAIVVAALLIFGFGRPLLKRVLAAPPPEARKAANRAAIGGQIAAALADQTRANPGGAVTLDMIEAAPGYSNRAELIRNFVRQDPARAALVVRDLIRSDMPGGDAQNG
jgi:flagellar M-ring protein FliF